MANEKRLIPCGEKCTLDDLPCGAIFAFGNDCIAVKSEYRCNNGLIEAFIVDSGEQFWGGVHTAEEQNALMVQPLAIEEVDAVEVVHAHWEDGWGEDCYGNIAYKSIDCSNCTEIFKIESRDREYWKNRFKVCPFCGAKMDGGIKDGK